MALAAPIAAVTLLFLHAQLDRPDPSGMRSDIVETAPGTDLALTAHEVPDMARLLADFERAARAPPAARRPIVLWLGNSQLHSINRYRPGDHLAPYWLAAGSDCAPCPLPLALSLANANLQEHLLLARRAADRVPLSLVVLKLVYDDLREDGLRDELAGLDGIGPPKRSAPADDEGSLQSRLETGLSDALGRLSPLWSDRGRLRSLLLIHLYELRNVLLGIRATSVRRMIPARRERNMRALEDMLGGLANDGVPVLVYVAPIRQGIAMPYDVRDYAAWKGDAERVARAHGARFLNLERLVPAQAWGHLREEEPDFMHFTGEGHKLLAAALRPEVLSLLTRRKAP